MTLQAQRRDGRSAAKPSNSIVYATPLLDACQ